MNHLKATSTVNYEIEDVLNKSKTFNGSTIPNNILNCSLHYVCLECLCCFNQKPQNEKQPIVEVKKSDEQDKKTEIIEIPPKLGPDLPIKLSYSNENSSLSGQTDHSPNIAQRRRHILLPKIQTKFIDDKDNSTWYETDEQLVTDQSVIHLKSFQVQPDSGLTLGSTTKSICECSTQSSLVPQQLSPNNHEFINQICVDDHDHPDTYTFNDHNESLSLNNNILCTRRRSTIEVSNRPEGDSKQTFGVWNKRNTSSHENICYKYTNTLHIGADCPKRRLPYMKTAQNLVEEKELQNSTHIIDITGPKNLSKCWMEEFTKMPTNIRNIKNFKGIDLKLRNRYITNIPIEETRIHLPPKNNEKRSNCVYINANLVKGHPKGLGDYIATEGPLPCTVNDFWQLAWLSKAPVILMLTELNENKMNKCELYLPTLFCNNAATGHNTKPQSVIRSDTEPTKPSDNPNETFNTNTSTQNMLDPDAKLKTKKSIFSDRAGSAKHNNQIAVDIECIPGAQRMFGDINVKIIDFIQYEKHNIREILLTHEGEHRRIFHVWMPSWKDHTGGPKSHELFNVIKDVRKICKLSKVDNKIIKNANSGYYPHSLKSPGKATHLWANNSTAVSEKGDTVKHEYQISPSNGPIIVHCSAGLGRTGCFIAIDIGLDQLIHDHNIDVMKTVSHMRLQRGGLVETFEQYEYIYQTLITFAQKELSTSDYFDEENSELDKDLPR